MSWRLIRVGENNDAFTSMSIDEAIMHHVKNGKSSPTFRIYGWSPPAVSIGYFLKMEEEVDLEMCSKFGVDHIRRLTSGGAVLHDMEVAYTLTTREDDPLIPKNILESYELLCGGIVQGLAELGIDATYKPVNDVLVNGKKISGNAQSRREHVILQHGTLLMDVDAEKMFSILKVPSEKAQNIEKRVTSLKHVLGREVESKEVMDAVVRGFKKALGIEFEEGMPSESELELAESIKKERFANPEWNYRR